MARKKGLHITKEGLYSLIQELIGAEDWLLDEKLINPANNCYRYAIKHDEGNFYVDVFYRTDRTITVNPYVASGNGEKSKELCTYIEENAPYKEIPQGEFLVEISNEYMNLLIDYLKEVDGVSLINEFDNGINGKGYTFLSDIGDKITLTYYSTTGRMRFQGMMLQLCAEVKCFIAPLGHIYVEKTDTGTVENDIYSVIEKFMPNSYSNLSVLQQDLIHDSVAQIVCKPVTRDFSVWTFSILKGLESRIKDIFAHESIIIYDKQGFSIFDKKEQKKKGLFFQNRNGKYVVNTSIVSINDGNTLNMLSDLYDYFNRNRNCLFHTRQFGATKTLGSEAEAIYIIQNVMRLFENSYNVLGY